MGRSRASSGRRENRSIPGERSNTGWRSILRLTCLLQLLKPPTGRPITHLSVSPSGKYLAILTSHTAHIALVPSSSHLQTLSTSPLRLKTFQLGPTAHVLETSPLVSALWHPLAPPEEDSLVTITHDACVRLWELDPMNRSSFSEPALAVDLKKLANATSAHSDLSASKYGANRGYSPDEVEMQVAGACFGGSGAEGEDGWAGMTLWVAMTEGDVYALCPFLPTRWRAEPGVLGSLSTAIMVEGEGRGIEMRRRWLKEVDAQDPILLPSATNDFETVEIYTRPAGLSSVPKLQGPFTLSPEPDFGEITDIYVVPPKLNTDALYSEDEDTDGQDSGLSVGIVCLGTSTNEVHVCLSLSSIEAEWLPNKRSRSTYALDDELDDKDLLLFETIDLVPEGSESEDNGMPVFTPDPTSRYRVFVTHPSGVSSLDFSTWAAALEGELASPSDSGVGFRLDVVLESTQTEVGTPVTFPSSRPPNESVESMPSTAIAVTDPSNDTLTLLALAPSTEPYTTLLTMYSSSVNPFLPDEPATLSLPAPEARPAYRPPQSLAQPPRNSLADLVSNRNHNNVQNFAKGQIRFSPATLQLLTEAHRVLSAETHKLAVGVAELFRTGERMRAELKAEVEKAAEINARVDAVTGDDQAAEGDSDGDGDDEPEGTTRERIEHRVETVRERNKQLSLRYERLRRKVGQLGGKELSEKEKHFAQEVARLERNVQPAAGVDGIPAPDDSGKGDQSETLAARFEAIRTIHESILTQIRVAPKDASAAAGKGDDSAPDEANSAGVGNEYRRRQLEKVWEMLEREGALVEGVGERLRRLMVG